VSIYVFFFVVFLLSIFFIVIMHTTIQKFDFTNIFLRKLVLLFSKNATIDQK